MKSALANTSSDRCFSMNKAEIFNERPWLSHRIAEALKRTGTDIYWRDIDIIDWAMKGTAAFWMDDEGELLVVTRLHRYPTGHQELELFLISGDFGQFWKMRERLLRYARETGCTTIAGTGRKGWEKIFKDLPDAAVTVSRITKGI